jgi:glutathione S-transferase
VASVIDFGMKFNIIPKRPEFETYVEPLVARPARQRVEEQIEKLLTQKAPPST